MSASNPSGLVLSAATAMGAGAKFQMHGDDYTFQIYGTTSAGAGSVTVVMQASNVVSPATAATSTDWVNLSSTVMVLSTTQASEVALLDNPYRWLRVRVTAISGTDATVSVLASRE